MLWQILLFLWIVLVAKAPAYRLVYALFWPGSQGGLIYGHTVWAMWQLQQRLAALMLLVCELLKPLLIYFTVMFFFKSDVLALWFVFFEVLVSWLTFHKVQKGKFNVGFKPSLAPFMAFHFLLSPVLALILLMLWLGCFLASKRLASSGLTVYLLSPLLLLLVVDYQLPYYLGLTLSVGAAWGLKNVLMRDYPFKERVF